ncbi:MAG TPA: PAS domain-containing protein, partial [Arachnia sp.]|nr:PAS domain-containing protein [Arachnia sp.]
MAPAPGTPYPSSRARTVSPGPAAATSDDPLAVTDEEARIHVIDAEWRRAVMESIRDGMILFDSEGLVVEMNQAFADLFGYGLEEGPFRPPYPWWPTEEE